MAVVHVSPFTRNTFSSDLIRLDPFIIQVSDQKVAIILDYLSVNHPLCVHTPSDIF